MEQEIVNNDNFMKRAITLAHEISKSWENNHYIQNLWKEIMDAQPNAIITLDCNDIDMFHGHDNEVAGIESCILANEPNRLSTLMEQIKQDASFDTAVSRLILCLFIPSEIPLMMEEMVAVNEWMSSFSNDDVCIKWGIATEDNSKLVRAIVLLQT